jgi:hypothetical protein
MKWDFLCPESAVLTKETTILDSVLQLNTSELGGWRFTWRRATTFWHISILTLGKGCGL